MIVFSHWFTGLRYIPTGAELQPIVSESHGCVFQPQERNRFTMEVASDGRQFLGTVGWQGNNGKKHGDNDI